jgi:hypothetical protein
MSPLTDAWRHEALGTPFPYNSPVENTTVLFVQV